MNTVSENTESSNALKPMLGDIFFVSSATVVRITNKIIYIQKKEKMKRLKLLLIIILGMILISCEREELPKSCNCHIEGKKMISFDNGKTWDLNEIDGRTGMLFPCSYDGLETNQEITADGIKYKTVWNCKD